MPLHNPLGLSATDTKWLSVVGIGEDGVNGLSPRARDRIAQAEIVMGGRRHLALAQSLITGEARAWPEPFDPSMQDLIALQGRQVCVLASGDPFLFGVGATIARVIDAEEIDVLPAPSAFSLAAARLGWALQDIETVSLHGRPIDLIRPLLHPARRVLALTSDGQAPAAIAASLRELGFGASRLHVLEALGGPQERLTSWTATEPLPSFDPLNVLAIEVTAGNDARILPLGFGLADDLFEHDGQITKRPIRAATLSALAPRRGELLWDVGAGSGSVAIEWMLAHPSMRAIAVEHEPERVARIRCNATRFGVPGLKLVEGRVPDALSHLPQPDAIFVGGGGSDEGTMDAVVAALKPGGRLVANSVTLEMEAVLLALHARLGGDLIQVSVARASKIGSMSGWRPSMPVMQWMWVKP
ncbi:precorrin-6y C5,15-methyltransferase (decarboxylating) subunit CbiE [Tianweitania sp. BSSL-BM11]|uniref:Precorrin-6y C5,15-methyltransferase (Decarboxylating) subunit CbiE n=1 Tax=Tianweitania aestuarii TaxID=2814886 RepID=A0ABS5RWA7_9HYPH|nr:precorrin-6y C5,15-methyltransferase (decarboxylating) subunit CbiE [Tianweitania aestuarii]MBS9720587.1 precorrin-6y C5,15-methyltransferase (decarboxylating) subunit CbiE [Tianweitania aestuarii]